MKDTFKALVVREEEGQVQCKVEEVSQEFLSPGHVLVKVAYSSVNYKDMLAVQTKGGVIRSYPMIPGIDFSGWVVSDSSGSYDQGDRVLLTGFDVGMTHTGGFAEYAQVPKEWLVPCPKDLGLKEAMIMGTAGFTAALSIAELEAKGMAEDKDKAILVTGATGGVASIGIQLLKASGYKNIHALTRKSSQVKTLENLGANCVHLAEDLIPEKPRLLAKQVFHYVLDVVGGSVASGLLPQIHYGGAMSMCGNAAGISLSTSVMPFILRGISLLGVDSVNYPMKNRYAIWDRFSKDWHIMDQSMIKEISLDQLSEAFSQLKQGSHVGRYIVKITEE